MSLTSPITDIDWLYRIDAVDGQWGVWEVEALLQDGYTVRGRVQGDGTVWDEESFEEDDTV